MIEAKAEIDKFTITEGGINTSLPTCDRTNGKMDIKYIQYLNNTLIKFDISDLCSTLPSIIPEEMPFSSV